jgi:hypothetical protein
MPRAFGCPRSPIQDAVVNGPNAASSLLGLGRDGGRKRRVSAYMGRSGASHARHER